MKSNKPKSKPKLKPVKITKQTTVKNPVKPRK